MPAKGLPKSFMLDGMKFNLLDVQYSKSNAELAGQIYSSRLPKAKYAINHVTVNGKTVWGLYTTMKVSNSIEKKKKGG